MKKILNSIKKNLYIVVFLPIITNSLINLSQDQKFLYFTEPKVYIFLISFCFACMFFYSISIIIDNSFELSSKSLSITYFLLSYFLFDNLLLPFTKYVKFKISFYIVSILWIYIIVFIKKHYFASLKVVLIYIAWRLYNFKYIDQLSDLMEYKELNTDVPLQWFKLAKLIYDNNYFHALENNLIEGQGLLPSYIQSLLLSIGFNVQNFIFIQLTSNILIFFGILLIFDLNISKNEKIILSLAFLSLVLNNDWLFYLIGNSLMLEGIVSFLIGVFLLNYKKYFDEDSLKSKVFFLFFGSLILTKNFVSIMTLFLVLGGIIFIKKNKSIVLGFVVYLFYLSYEKILFREINSISYTGEINFKILFQDLIFLRNLYFTNIGNILNQLYLDKPLFYFFTIFLILNIYNFITSKNIEFTEAFILIFVLVNYLLVNILYISYWQSIEYESSYRYIINTFYLVLISTGLNASKLIKKINF